MSTIRAHLLDSALDQAKEIAEQDRAEPASKQRFFALAKSADVELHPGDRNDFTRH